MAVKRLNGEGSIRKKIVKGKTYCEGRYTDAQGKQRSVSGKTQSEVRDKLKKIQDKIEKEKQEKEARENGRVYYDKDMTLNEWYNIYMNTFTKHIKPQTRYIHEMQYKSAFRHTIGDMRLKYISEEDLLDLMVVLKNRGLSVNTINLYLQFLATLLNKAVSKDIIKNNPVKALNLKPQKTKKPKRELTTEEIELLLQVTEQKRNYLAPLFKFLLHTGCRIGEAISIEWQDISPDMKFCMISKTRTTYKDHNGKFTTTDSSPKNETSERKIPIDNEIKNMLLSLRTMREEQNQFAKDKKIFLAKKFGVMHETYVASQLKGICGYIQSNYDENFPDISSHWFRHTFTSKGISQNVPMYYLQKIGGWGNMNMISKVYGHMNDVQAIESVNNIYRNNN